MARGCVKLSKAQKARNREATTRSLASRRDRKDAAKPFADSIELLQQDCADAKHKLSAAKAEGQRSKAAAKSAVTAAKRDKYNAERRIHRLEAKLAERELNTTAVPTSLYPSTTFIPSPFPPIASTSTSVATSHSDSEAGASQAGTTSTSLFHETAATTPQAATYGMPTSDLVTIPCTQLVALRKERKKLLRQVECFRKRCEQDKLALSELRGQLRERPLKRIFPYKTKSGMITEDTRTMIRELVALGVPHAKVKDASQIVLAAAGYATDGDFDRHSISRIVREGYVAAAMHVMYEVSEADIDLDRQRLGRKLDRAGLGKKKRNALMLAKRARVHRHREKRDLRVAAQEKKNAVIDGVTPILDANYWSTVDKRTITVDKHIKLQLYWHQRANPGAKVKVTGKKDLLIEALISAIEYNNAHSPIANDTPIPSSQSLELLTSSSSTATVPDDTMETDSEYEEEELLQS
ncbi:uncharacterized protein B0H18DRAFT_1117043 [Fomitopsis serialis]|uniref:uncharacterized protein n=1 Tax=Fomitopsis serialis TaxID=139415 RepID=UPI002008C6F8|nr:uncharacterized protein B0H18DRAFT_1117043 [Neoantrodia serialis]KAH9930363.1 hypothetical protein B0H18DRAFT_1117043 [Neoantrodia serialis]